MTVSTSQRRVQYVLDGATTNFPVPFPFPAAGDLRVVRTAATGAEQALTLNADYAVTGAGNQNGGTVTLPAPGVAGERLTIKRIVARTQETDYVPNDPFPANAHEAALDKLTMIAQEDSDELARAVMVPETDPARGAMLLPPMPGRAGRFAAFDSEGRIVSASGTGADSALREDLADEAGSALIGHNSLHFPSITRSLRSKLSDRVSLMDVLLPSERLAVLAGDDPGTIGARLNALLAAAPAGAEIDATMLRGDVLLATDPFAGIRTAHVKLVTAECTFRRDFQTLGTLATPSKFEWEWWGTRLVPTAPVTNWPGDYTQGFGLLSTQLFYGLVSGTAGQDTLTVPDGSLFHPGTPIVLVATRDFPLISNTIVEAMTASSPGTITFGTSAAFKMAAGVAHLRIDSEIIRVIVANDGLTATVTERGALGTAAASHSAGVACIARAGTVYTVLGVEGNVLTLNAALATSFTNAPFYAGTVDTRITGWGEIDGLYDRTQTVDRLWFGVLSTMSRDLVIDGKFRLVNLHWGGLMLQGTRGARVDVKNIFGTGELNDDPALNRGGSVWLFGDCYRSTVRADVVSDGYIGAVIDNKSSNISRLGLVEGPQECRVEYGVLSSHIFPCAIDGARRNHFEVGTDTSESGPIIGDGLPQTDSAPDIGGNSILIHKALNADSYVVPVRVKNAADQNVVIGGRSGRVIEQTVTIGGAINIAAQSTTYVNFTLAGARQADRFSALPQIDLPEGVTMFAVRPAADDSIRLGFANATAGAVSITGPSSYAARAEGLWNE